MTPMMQQYEEIKARHRDAILFFRLGDFYEMFGADAEVASRVLEIALTGRDAGAAGRVPMCGVPYHAAEGYIAKLIHQGYKVAICEQTEDPKQAKGIVRREVIRVISPGTVMESSMLDEKKNNYLVAVSNSAKGFGLAVADISTGDFRLSEVAGQGARAKLMDELTRLNPAEVLLPASSQFAGIVSSTGVPLTELDEHAFDFNAAVKVLRKHFAPMSLEGFGCQYMELGLQAAGALLAYLQTSGGSLSHLNKLLPYRLDNFMILDGATRRNLELTKTIREQDKKGSLLGVLDLTLTAMGGRLLKLWLEQPLIDLKEIQLRQSQVDALYQDYMLRSDTREALKQVYDLERLLGRVVFGSANAKDLLALKSSLEVLPEIKTLLQGKSPLDNASSLQVLADKLDLLEDVYKLLSVSINPEAPFSLREGNLIKNGFNPEIDEYRYIASHGKEWVAALESRERERTGIKSLKVGFNKVFGYYLEVTQANLASVPEDYIRKQTLANAERYITPELKEYENKILGAEEKLVNLEYQVFCRIREQVGERAGGIQQTAGVLAQVDVLASLGEAAERNGYTKPQVSCSSAIHIRDGRHPVVEKVLQEDFFVPNDTELDQLEHRLAIITGPNMAGKSTYMRQVALIVLMAQIGSFVPALEAEIGIVDRIFTRVGASDDLSTGQSTFMVEMNEVANILNNATSSSLIILDEIGRGTATYDGLSIAWAVAEYIQNPELIGAKTLFATHYHELTKLAEILPGVCNYRIAVKEHGENIVFLRKIVPGSADRSYGIQVARIAGLPRNVLERAKAILHDLEHSGIAVQDRDLQEPEQLSFTLVTQDRPGPADELYNRLQELNINELTPMQAINLLADWKRALLQGEDIC